MAAAPDLKARALIVDSIQTMYSERIDAGARRGLAAARMHGRIGPLRQDERHRRAAGRPCDQGRADRRPPGARAHGRYGAVFRERYRQPFRVCVRSRIASAPPMRSACSPWRSRGCARSPIHPRFSCRDIPRRFRAAYHGDARRARVRLLIEVQVLADASLGANPRRVAVGIDGNRLTMLLAVAHRHAGLLLHGQDVFANVVGGVRLAETAGDLAIVLAARSSLRDRAAARIRSSCSANWGSPGRSARCRSARSACARRPNTASRRAGAGGERAEARAGRHDGARRDAPERGARGIRVRREIDRLCV